MSQATIVTIVFGAVSTVATTLTVPEVRTAFRLEDELPQSIKGDLPESLGLREETESPPPAPPPATSPPAPPPTISSPPALPPTAPPPVPPPPAPSPPAPSPEKLEADVRQAVKDYYEAVVQENWSYTFDNLALQTRRMFTNKEEWIKKNKWYADNYPQELGSTVHILDVNVFPSREEADVKIQLTFKDGSRLEPRDTRFVYQESSWKHLFLKEEIDIFRPGVPFDEFEKAQQTGSFQSSTKTNSKGDTSVKGKAG